MRRPTWNEEPQHSIDHLRYMLQHGEGLLRAYDIKAEIAMICFVLSVEALNVLTDFSRIRTVAPAMALTMLIVFIGAVCGYLSVLLPVYKLKAAHATDYSPINIFFVTEPRACTPDQYLRTLMAADQSKEMSEQILRLAEIRDRKHIRFQVALFLTLLFYALALACGGRGAVAA